MIRHCVFVRLRPDRSLAEWLAVAAGLRGLVADLPGALTYDEGPNVSPEVGMDKGFSRGFIIDFADAAARDAYLSDPRHVALGRQVLELAESGEAGVLVFDLAVP